MWHRVPRVRPQWNTITFCPIARIVIRSRTPPELEGFVLGKKGSSSPYPPGTSGTASTFTVTSAGLEPRWLPSKPTPFRRASPQATPRGQGQAIDRTMPPPASYLTPSADRRRAPWRGVRQAEVGDILVCTLLYGFVPDLPSRCLSIAFLAASLDGQRFGYVVAASAGLAISTPPSAVIRSLGEGIRSLALMRRLTGTVTGRGTLPNTQTSTGLASVLHGHDTIFD